MVFNDSGLHLVTSVPQKRSPSEWPTRLRGTFSMASSPIGRAVARAHVTGWAIDAGACGSPASLTTVVTYEQLVGRDFEVSFLRWPHRAPQRQLHHGRRRIELPPRPPPSAIGRRPADVFALVRPPWCGRAAIYLASLSCSGWRREIWSFEQAFSCVRARM